MKLGISGLITLLIWAGAPALGDPAAVATISDNLGLRALPNVEFLSVPAVGSTAPLTGRVRHADPDRHAVAIYIYVFGWWTKPSWANPLTPIRADGTWTAPIVTGGSDACATRIAAYVVPADYTPPQLGGQPELPLELEQKAVARRVIDRAALARQILFSGFEWAVKSTGSCEWGPGPNYYSDSTDNVWVDVAGRLHLRLTFRAGRWHCAEVALQRSLGYGTYRFTLETPVDNFDAHVVLGLFTWSDDPAFNHREIDIEFSKWSEPANPNNAQYVVQPFTRPQQLLAFRQPARVPVSSHSFAWHPDRIDFQSWRGASAPPSDNTQVIRQWTFTRSAAVPPPGDETVRLNLWLFNSVPPADKQEVEVIVSEFAFEPATPDLKIAREDRSVVIAWPAAFERFGLESSASARGPWAAWPDTPTVKEGYRQISVRPAALESFFRLRQ